MKFRIHLTTLLALCLTISLFAQKKTITGNGNIKEEPRSVSGFDAIEVIAGIDIYVKQGSSESVIVKADENLVDKIVTKVEGNTLKVYPVKNTRIKRSTSFEVHVTVDDLSAISASGGSDVKGEGKISSNKLSLAMSGGSDIEMEVDVSDLVCALSGGSDADLSGTAKSWTGNASGGSDISANNLKVGKCVLKVSGGSDATIHVDGDLEVEASGASDVTVRGNPNIIKKKASGGSDIHMK